MTTPIQALDAIVAEMSVLWPPPKTVRTDADAGIYLKAWAQAVLDETTDTGALVGAWRDLKRLHEFHCWPTAGQVCALIRQWRLDHRAKPDEPKALPTPDYINEVWTQAQWATHLEYMAIARDEFVKGNKIMGPVIKLGEAMMARQERQAKARAA